MLKNVAQKKKIVLSTQLYKITLVKKFSFEKSKCKYLPTSSSEKMTVLTVKWEEEKKKQLKHGIK